MIYGLRENTSQSRIKKIKKIKILIFYIYLVSISILSLITHDYNIFHTDDFVNKYGYYPFIILIFIINFELIKKIYNLSGFRRRSNRIHGNEINSIVPGEGM